MWRKIAPASMAALALTAGLAACVHHAPPPALRPALSGTWLLTATRATTTGDSLAETSMRAESPYGGGDDGDWNGSRGSRGQRGGRGEPGYSRAGRYNPQAVAVALAAIKRGQERVTIAQTDSMVHFSYADGSYFDLVPDGHHQDDIWRNVGRIKSMARWTDAGLVLQRRIEGGATVTQTFSRPAGSSELVVQTVVSGPMPRPIRQRRVYSTAPAKH